MSAVREDDDAKSLIPFGIFCLRYQTNLANLGLSKCRGAQAFPVMIGRQFEERYLSCV